MLGGIALGARNDMAGEGAIENAVARLARDFGKTIRPPRLRRLRQRDEKGGFGNREPARLLAEIGETCGSHALDIAAIRRKGEIEIENLFLAVMAFKLDRADDLAQFRAEGFFRARLQKPRDLHRQGRTAGDDMAMREQLAHGAAQGSEIDAMMTIEAPVFIGEQHGDVALVDLLALAGRRQRPSGMVKARSRTPLRSSTTGEPRCASSSFNGPSEAR